MFKKYEVPTYFHFCTFHFKKFVMDGLFTNGNLEMNIIDKIITSLHIHMQS